MIDNDPALRESLRQLRVEVALAADSLSDHDEAATRAHVTAAQRLVHTVEAQIRVLALAFAAPF